MLESIFFIQLLIYFTAACTNYFLFNIKYKNQLKFSSAIVFSSIIFILYNFLEDQQLLAISILLLPILYTQIKNQDQANNQLLLNLIAIAIFTSLFATPLNSIISVLILTILNFLIHSKLILPQTHHQISITLDGLNWQNLHKDINLQTQLENMLAGSLISFKILEINQAQDTVSIEATYAK